MRENVASPLIVMVRGPIGAGKTALMRGLARDRLWGFYALDADAALSHTLEDPMGEHLDFEWPICIDILALNAKIVLGRGRNLVMDPGQFLTSANVDRFLRTVGRSRNDPRVISVRLTVPVAEAVRRKTTLEPRYVRASHKGWVTRPIPGEVVIDTGGKTKAQVLREAKVALRLRAPCP